MTSLEKAHPIFGKNSSFANDVTSVPSKILTTAKMPK